MHIPYLLKWTPGLQLFSGLERCGVYLRAATIRGCVRVHYWQYKFNIIGE